MRIFEIISNNTSILLSELEKNQNLKKLVKVREDSPLGYANITDKMIYKELQPYPFSPESVRDQDGVILRVYIQGGGLDETQVKMDEILILFDIIVPISMWTVNVPRKSDGKMVKAVRPVLIMDEIMKTFESKEKVPEQSKSTLGRLKFGEFRLLPVNENYHGYRLEAYVFGINER